MSNSSNPESDNSATDFPSEVKVRRSPRITNFLVLGALVGLVVTAIATFSFPENEHYSRFQVFTFTGIILVAAGAAAGGIVAIVLERISRSRARTVRIQRSELHQAAEAVNDVPSTQQEETPEAADGTSAADQGDASEPGR